MARGETPGRGEQKRGFLGAIVKAFVALVFIGAVALGGGLYFAHQELHAPGPETSTGEPTIVLIPRGTSVAGMARILEDAGTIEDSRYFRVAARYLQATTTMKAGEFEIASGASLKEIVETLSDGKSVLHPVTIPEGLTTQMVLDIIAASDVLSGDMPESLPLEGVLLPDTYLVHRGETRQQLIERMKKAGRDVLNAAWDNRQTGLPLQSKQEALILASIVEKETAIAEERPRIASVFINRLNYPMRLQTDPTIIYGVCKFHPDRCVNGRLVDKNGEQRGIRQSEIAMDTGYNTYQIDGLPPTPICNPGREAIEAVLNPPATKDYYFVADGTGGHVFARTHAQHLKNVAVWRRIERNRR